MTGLIRTEEHARHISEGLIGKPSPNKGWKSWFKHTEEFRQKMSERIKGKGNPIWKGGITPECRIIRTTEKYEEWRIQVFKRDNYICQECGQWGRKLNVHHEIPFRVIYQKGKNNPELFDIKNGITLCERCHKDLHGKERKGKSAIRIWAA